MVWFLRTCQSFSSFLTIEIIEIFSAYLAENLKLENLICLNILEYTKLARPLFEPLKHSIQVWLNQCLFFIIYDYQRYPLSFESHAQDITW